MSIISKELLSEVLGKDVNFVKTISIKGTGLYYTCVRNGNNSDGRANLHELVFECKSWAYREGYILVEYDYKIVIHEKDSISRDTITNTSIENFFAFDPYMVIKACQWILDNKDK